MNRHRAAARDLPAAAGWGGLLAASLAFMVLTLHHLAISAGPGQTVLTGVLTLAWILLAAYFARATAHSLTRR